MENILKGLNERQAEAVTSTEGFVRIIAGAGSGKTKALTHRYAFIVRDLGVPPANVLCVTFTNKAANEMKKRVRALIGDGYDTSLVTTYHGFCVRVLRESISKLFYPESFIILDKLDQKKILEEIYEELEIKLDKSTFEKIIKKIDAYKRKNDYVTKMINTEPFGDNFSADIDQKIIEKYLQRQRKVFALDFNDLINFTFMLFEKYPEVKEMWQDRLMYIQVDEFQDSSYRELNLVDILSAKHKNLFVVGDPDQNIYEWRGAKVEILVDFDKTHQDTKTVLMEQNYRSTPQILDVANSLIDKNVIRIKKNLFTENPSGRKPVCSHLHTEKEESEYIATKLAELHARGYSYKDMAVLYRANYLSRAVEQGLYTKNIPYTIYGGVRFYDRMEIKDALCYLRLITHKDDYSLLRVINVPKRRFGRAAVMQLKEYAEKHRLGLWQALKEMLADGEYSRSDVRGLISAIDDITEDYNTKGTEKLPISQLFTRLLEETGYERYIRENGDMERLENLAELKKNITDFERTYIEAATIERYLQLASLYANEDDTKETDAVKLMTVHTSKGLEFPVVFICGLTDTIFPSARSIEERKTSALEEERRLMFVGVTRAKYELYLTESEGFTNQGKAKIPSRFIYDIDSELLEIVGKLPPKQGMPQSVQPSGITHLQPGERVVHGFFGIGEIREADEEKQIYNVFFDKLNALRPISFDYSWKPVDLSIPPSQKLPPRPSMPPAKPIAANEAPEPTVKPEPLPKSKNANEDSRLAAEREAVRKQIESWTVEDLPDSKDEPLPDTDTDDTVSEKANDASAIQLNSPPEEKVKKKSVKEIIREGNVSNKWNDPDFPKSGWVCTGVTDLGMPIKVCEMCGEQVIRYVHHMLHTSGMTLNVGCVCAGRLEGNEENAKSRETFYKRKFLREKNFFKREWKQNGNGNLWLKVRGKVLTIYKDKFNDGFWCVAYNGSFANRIPSFDEAKKTAFELCDSDKEEQDNN